jgi:hypothetical protein
VRQPAILSPARATKFALLSSTFAGRRFYWPSCRFAHQFSASQAVKLIKKATAAQPFIVFINKSIRYKILKFGLFYDKTRPFETKT